MAVGRLPFRYKYVELMVFIAHDFAIKRANGGEDKTSSTG